MWLILLALCFLPNSLWAETSILFTDAYYGKVYRVFSSGKIEDIGFDFKLRGYQGSVHEGSNAPRPSPNRRYIAFVRKQDLWLLDLETRGTAQVTRVAKPYTRQYTAINVLMTDWSADSREILYSVSPVDNMDGLPARPANYGFHIYQLETRKTRRINLPGHYLAWLPGGDFLLVSSEEKPLEKRLLRFTPGDAEPKAVAKQRGWYGQVHASSNGRWIVAALPQGSPSEAVSQIVKIDLADGEMTNITPQGRFAEYQSPQFSPSGRFVSYIRNEGTESSKWRKATLIVDRKPVQEIVGYLKHRWIDDQSIVYLNRKLKELVVLDSNSGEAKGRQKL